MRVSNSCMDSILGRSHNPPRLPSMLNEIQCHVRVNRTFMTSCSLHASQGHTYIDMFSAATRTWVHFLPTCIIYRQCSVTACSIWARSSNAAEMTEPYRHSKKAEIKLRRLCSELSGRRMSLHFASSALRVNLPRVA